MILHLIRQRAGLNRWIANLRRNKDLKPAHKRCLLRRRHLLKRIPKVVQAVLNGGHAVLTHCLNWNNASILCLKD